MDFRLKFDGSSTAYQVLHGHDLSGKVVVITGATAGIGYETAKSLAQHGAEIVLCGRSENTCKLAEEKILGFRPGAKVFPLPMELTSLASVKNGAALIKQRYKAINFLILNAGVCSLGWTQTSDGLETLFQVNHLAQFYLTLLLEDLLIPGSRVIIVSSEGHRFVNISRNKISEERLSPTTPSKYSDLMAYNNSKLCNILFGKELSKRLKPRKIDVFSCHPGTLVSTKLPRRSCWLRAVFALVRPFTKSVQQAAATIVYCAVASEVKGLGGVYLNNCWLCEPSQAAQDQILAKKLWDISEEIVSRICGSLKI